MMMMFNPDPLDLRGRVVVEPSAGSGNLAQAALARGAEEVLCCEPEQQRRAKRGRKVVG